MSALKPVRRRRSTTRAFKVEVVAQAREPGVSVAAVALRYGINANVVFSWLRDRRFDAAPAFVPVEVRPSPATVIDQPVASQRLDLVIELPGGARLCCGDERALVAALRALRRAA
jgi:transposase-like protein